MFCGEGGKPFLQEAAIEIGVMGNNEHYPVEQVVYDAIIDAMTGNHRIGNAGDLRDLRRDRKTRVIEPFPRAEEFVDPPVLAVVFEEADTEFYNFVAIGVGGGGLDIDHGGDELWNIVGRVVFGQRPQPTGDG